MAGSKIGCSTRPLFKLISHYHNSNIKSIYIKYITKSAEDRFREAIISKVLLHLNAIRVLLERHTGPFEGIWGSVAKNFLLWPKAGNLNIYPKSSLL